MIDFLKSRKVGKSKKSSMSDISKIAKEERERILREKIRKIITEELENSGINQRIVDISKSVKSVEKMVENLKSSLVPLSRTKSDSIRKIKMKRIILELFEKHNRLTASDVSLKLNLSRTRCSEYLTELEKSGLTEGIIISRQKFYTLKNQ